MNYPRQQTFYDTDYYLTVPTKFINYYTKGKSLSMYFSSKECPFYAPIAQNAHCRLCMKDPENHRKYNMYSYFARKIQMIWIKYYKRKKLYNLIHKMNLPCIIHSNVVNYCY